MKPLDNRLIQPFDASAELSLGLKYPATPVEPKEPLYSGLLLSAMYQYSALLVHLTITTAGLKPV